MQGQEVYNTVAATQPLQKRAEVLYSCILVQHASKYLVLVVLIKVNACAMTRNWHGQSCIRCAMHTPLSQEAHMAPDPAQCGHTYASIGHWPVRITPTLSAHTAS